MCTAGLRRQLLFMSRAFACPPIPKTVPCSLPLYSMPLCVKVNGRLPTQPVCKYIPLNIPLKIGRDVLSRRSVLKEVDKPMINTNKTVNIRCVVILVLWYFSWYFKKSGKIMYKFRYLQFCFVIYLKRIKRRCRFRAQP